MKSMGIYTRPAKEVDAYELLLFVCSLARPYLDPAVIEVSIYARSAESIDWSNGCC
jgi:hypothetical protein